jgi:hypothetical protein
MVQPDRGALRRGRDGHGETVHAQNLEILRQKLDPQRSHREVSRSLGVSLGVVSKVVCRLRASGLSWQRWTRCCARRAA